jgi:cell division protein FtsB
MNCCKEYNSKLLSIIDNLKMENTKLRNRLNEIEEENENIFKINTEMEKNIDELNKANDIYEDTIDKQTQYLTQNGIHDKDTYINIIENKDKILKYDYINKKLLEKKIDIENIDETINNINKDITINNSLLTFSSSIDNNNNIQEPSTPVPNVNVNDNLLPISSNSTDANNKKDNASKMENKVKYSTKVLDGIINFYNNYDKSKFIIKEDKSNTDNIKRDINDTYDDIYSNKIIIIYNYYKLYNEYLKEKKNNIKLKFSNYIDDENNEVIRYKEKVIICYNFIKNLLEKVDNMPSFFGEDKMFSLINLLSKCRLSINKLYKLRKNEYKNLLDFLIPLYITKYKESYDNIKNQIDSKMLR